MEYNLLIIFNNSKSIQYIFNAIIELSKKYNIFYYLNHQMCNKTFTWDKLYISETNDIRIKLLKELNKNNCKCIGFKGDNISYEDKFKDTKKYNLVIIDDSNGYEKGKSHGYRLIYDIIKENNPNLKVVGNIEGLKDFNAKKYDNNKLKNLKNTELESICKSYKISYDYIFCWDKFQYNYLKKYINDEKKIFKIGVPYFDKLEKYKNETKKKYIILFTSMAYDSKKWVKISQEIIDFVIKFSKEQKCKLLIKEKPKSELHFKYLENENIIVNQCEGEELDNYISKARFIFSGGSTILIRCLLLNIPTIIFNDKYYGQLGFLENYYGIINKFNENEIHEKIKFLTENKNYIKNFNKDNYYGYNFDSTDKFIESCKKLISI